MARDEAPRARRHDIEVGGAGVSAKQTPALAEDERRGEIGPQASKTHSPKNTLIANNSQHAACWIASKYQLSLPLSVIIAEHAGLGER